MEPVTYQSQALADCRTSRPRRANCGLRISDLNHDALVIIDCDKCPDLFPESGEKPDFLVFYSEDSTVKVAVIEIKVGSLDASKACSQVAAGARIAEGLVERNAEVVFLPMILFGKGLKGIERAYLQKHGSIGFRGRQTATIYRRCETEFKRILSEHA